MNLRLRTLRTTLRAMDAVAPDLARRWTQHLFTTPPRHAAPEAERAALRRACPFRFSSGGLRLQGWSWGEGPAVLLAHGWGGRGSQLHAFVRPLLDEGYSVLAFDGPGHGRSEGRTASVPTFAQAMRDLAAARGPFHAVIGHSFGGATAAYALSRGLPASRAVLIAAPESPRIFYLELLEALGFPGARHEALLASLERDFGVRFDDVHGPSRAREIRVPGLVIHDASDREVPMAHGEAYAAAWPGAKLVRTQGLGHRRILRDAEVVAKTVAFLGEGAPLATGPVQGEGPRSLEWHLFRRDLRYA
ncbi:MAG TPA: alpha/beta fold hydrolase [Holophagaceae bacterium]|nr:alpha/beta fold hydrolase [Holophagaceae bacterium]